MGLFTLKKEESNLDSMPPPSMPIDTPTDRVISMRAQGLSDNQIIQSLRRESYNSNQIFEAMSQADLKRGVEEPPIPEMSGAPIGRPATQQMPPPMDSGQFMEDSQAGMGVSPYQAQMVYTQPQQSFVTRDEMEELVEAVVDEKWNELVDGVNKIIEWKGTVDEKIAKLEEDIITLQRGIDNLSKSVVSKIGEYDKNITDVGVQVKAMDKVFKDVLPTFTENVNQLSRFVKTQKKTPSKK